MKNLFRIFLVGFAVCLTSDAFGCTIPVFRYALEKWELTPYEILVYHRGPLSADLQMAIKSWDVTPARANIDITLIDLDDKVAPNLQKLWKREGDNKQTPWMLVRSSASGVNEPSAWTGPCTIANLQIVLNSPMRQAVLAHLTRGASVVSILLTSDDEKADAAAYALAMTELRSLEKLIKLPEQSKEGPQLRLPLPLKVSLPLLVLDRKKPEEAAFIQMLLATEEGLDKVKGPILFPIFGRGRVLGSFSGKELNKELIMQATHFLCKECSCQVKDLNPGVDMLVVANWNEIFDKLFEGKEPVPMPKPILVPTSFSSGLDAEISAVAEPTAKASESVPPVLTPTFTPVEAPSIQASCNGCPNSRCLLWGATGVAGGLVLFTGGWLVYLLRK